MTTTPTYHPLILPGPQAQAAHEGRLTEHRVVVEPQPEERPGLSGDGGGIWWHDRPLPIGQSKSFLVRFCCPFQVGDQLFVQEEVATPGPWNIPESCKLWYPVDGPCPFKEAVQYKSAERMPRWASRTTLVITAIRVEHGGSGKWEWVPSLKRLEAE